MEYQYTLINMLLFFGISIYTYKKRHIIGKHILLITVLWLVSSIFSLLYLDSPIRYYTNHQVKLLPYLYLYGCFLLTLMPLLRINVMGKDFIDNSTFIYKLSLFVALCAYLPFIENAIHLCKVGGGDSLAEMYGERLEEGFDARAHMSWLGARLQSVISFFTYISPILFFNYIAGNNKKKWYIVVGLLMASLNLSIVSFSQGGRGTSFNLLLYILFIYLLYKSYFSDKINRKVRLVFFVIGGFMVVIMGIITIGRFSEDSTYNLTDWILRYAGESFVNFNTELFYIDRYTDGRVCLPFLYDESQLDRFVIEAILGVRGIVFYTYIGDMYKDFGPYFTIVIIGLLSWLFYWKFKKNQVMNLGNTIIYCLYAALILLSTNCMFYRATSISGAFFALIFGLIYSKMKKNHV